MSILLVKAYDNVHVFVLALKWENCFTRLKV